MLEGIELLTCQHLMGYQTDTSNLKAKLEDDECPFQMVQGGSFKDPNYPRTPLNWNLTYSNVIQWSTWVWYIAIKYDMIWYDTIRYDLIWCGRMRYKLKGIIEQCMTEVCVVEKGECWLWGLGPSSWWKVSFMFAPRNIPPARMLHVREAQI